MRDVDPRWIVASLLVLTAAVFAPGARGGFVFDDHSLIVHNQHVRDPANLPRLLTSPFWDTSGHDPEGRSDYRNLYRPFVSLAYVTEYQLFGDAPLGYHLVSLFLHVACAGLALRFLYRRLPEGAGRWLAAGIGAAVFALHPSRPETVTWISGSTDLWMTFWALLGLTAVYESDRPIVRGAGFLCFALAFLSKEAALLVPLLMVTDALLVWRRRPRAGTEGMAGAGVLAAFLLHVAVVPFGGGWGPSGVVETAQRVSSTLGHFVLRTVWPFDPSIEPVLRRTDGLGHEVFEPWSMAVGAAVVVAFLVLAGLAVRRASLRPWLADALWFLVPLLPVLNLIPLQNSSLVADRFLFLPVLGLAAAVARVAHVLLARGSRVRTVALAGSALVVASFAATTVVSAERFASDEALWRHELARDPTHRDALLTLGNLTRAAHRHREAMELYRRGYEAAQADGMPEVGARFLLRAVSTLLNHTSDADQARLRAIRGFYDRLREEPVLRLDTDAMRIEQWMTERVWRGLRDDVDLVRMPQAIARARTLDLEGAERLLRGIVRDAPRKAAAWNLLAAVHARRGEWDEAERALRESSERVPDDANLVSMMRAVHAARELASQPAADPIARAIRDARVQVQLGAPEAARRILDPLLAEHPTHLELVMTRARVDVSDRRFDLARELLESVRERDPEHADRWTTALENLARAEAEAEARQ